VTVLNVVNVEEASSATSAFEHQEGRVAELDKNFSKMLCIPRQRPQSVPSREGQMKEQIGRNHQ